MSAGHTPGPWRWEVNRAHKSVKLCGGPPKRGFGRYDLTIMEFQRFGMNGAAPVFWFWDYNKAVGKPARADELAVAVDGREHHADWFADIDHPDARLIAAAPDLLSELDCRISDLTMLRKAIEAGDPRNELFVRIDDMIRESREAIAKATGAAS